MEPFSLMVVGSDTVSHVASSDAPKSPNVALGCPLSATPFLALSTSSKSLSLESKYMSDRDSGPTITGQLLIKLAPNFNRPSGRVVPCTHSSIWRRNAYGGKVQSAYRLAHPADHRLRMGDPTQQPVTARNNLLSSHWGSEN